MQSGHIFEENEAFNWSKKCRFFRANNLFEKRIYTGAGLKRLIISSTVFYLPSGTLSTVKNNDIFLFCHRDILWTSWHRGFLFCVRYTTVDKSITGITMLDKIIDYKIVYLHVLVCLVC